KPEKAKICWTGNNRVQNSVGLFLSEWTNPFPAKTIKSIDIIGALSGAQLGVVGIAGGVKKADTASSSLARWDFSELKDGKVADSVGGIILYLSKTSKDAADPVQVNLEGDAALKLDGQWFAGDLSKIANFNPDKPFTTKVSFSLAPLPDGSKDYGLFEAFSYMKCGFRIGVDPRTMNLWLEYYPRPDGKQTILRGKTALETGKAYELSIVFDASGAKLYLNGKIELVQGGTMPLPHKGLFYVGQCSGSGKLNGILRSAELWQGKQCLDKSPPCGIIKKEPDTR
ncbi:MAG: hypothetical protein WC637_17670, partial [Victivallales bacterium]